MLDAVGPRRNAAFVDPRAFVGQLGVQAAPAGATAIALERLESIAPVRRSVAELAVAAGIPKSKIDELLVAVSEVATNAVIHGRAPGWLWIYRRNGALVCHVADSGHGLPDPLIGYLAPSLDADDGRGLWLAHQLCDIVETAVNETGTHIYLRIQERRLTFATPRSRAHPSRTSAAAILPLEAFNWDPRVRDGRRADCRRCQRERSPSPARMCPDRRYRGAAHVS